MFSNMQWFILQHEVVYFIIILDALEHIYTPTPNKTSFKPAGVKPIPTCQTRLTLVTLISQHLKTIGLVKSLFCRKIFPNCLHFKIKALDLFSKKLLQI